jgi:hypothetical protein
MEAEELLAETLCEVAGEVPWRKVLARGRGAVTELSQKSADDAPHEAVGRKADEPRTSEARMELEKAPAVAPAASWAESVGNRAGKGGALAPAA